MEKKMGNEILDKIFSLYEKAQSESERILKKHYGKDYHSSFDPEGNFQLSKYEQDILILHKKKFYKPVADIRQSIDVQINTIINNKNFKDIISLIPDRSGKVQEDLIMDLAKHFSMYPKVDIPNWKEKKDLLLHVGIPLLSTFKRKFEAASFLIGFFTPSLTTGFIRRIHCCVEGDFPVLIIGESGTGKELLARIIHVLSERKGGPFKPINCSAIPMSLFESELFGHAKGAFTGASRDKVGLLASAESGTVFLDEIGDLEISGQIKLLRVLQENEFTPVGKVKTEPLKAKLIFATNQVDLKQLIEDGKFRNDFYHRINTLPIFLPTTKEVLKNRGREYGKLLLNIFLLRAFKKEQKCGRVNVQGILTDKAIQKLMSYDYPGNFRELENIFLRALCMCDRKKIDKKDIEFDYESNVSVADNKNTEISVDVNLKSLTEVKAIGESYKNKLIEEKVRAMLENNNGKTSICAIEAYPDMGDATANKKRNYGTKFKKEYCLPFNINYRDYRPGR